MYDEQPGEAGQLRYLLAQIEDRRADLEQRRQDVLAALDELAELERRCRDDLDGSSAQPREVEHGVPGRAVVVRRTDADVAQVAVQDVGPVARRRPSRPRPSTAALTAPAPMSSAATMAWQPVSIWLIDWCVMRAVDRPCSTAHGCA